MNMRVDSDIGFVAAGEWRIAPHRPAASRTKRVFDIVGATLILLFLLPVFAVTALCILIETGAPVFFVQRRTGLGGQLIPVIKFRTMKVAEDGPQVRQATRDDRRVTRVGRFLRRSSIDELPQLINVIRGEMSLVGPRPHAVAHDLYYAPLVPGYQKRFRTRPGITGLAQVHGLRGEITSMQAMVDRIELDNVYIETWSPLLDIQILFRTLSVAVFHPSAY